MVMCLQLLNYHMTTDVLCLSLSRFMNITVTWIDAILWTNTGLTLRPRGKVLGPSGLFSISFLTTLLLTPFYYIRGSLRKLERPLKRSQSIANSESQSYPPSLVATSPRRGQFLSKKTTSQFNHQLNCPLNDTFLLRPSKNTAIIADFRSGKHVSKTFLPCLRFGVLLGSVGVVMSYFVRVVAFSCTMAFTKISK